MYAFVRENSVNQQLKRHIKVYLTLFHQAYIIFQAFSWYKKKHFSQLFCTSICGHCKLVEFCHQLCWRDSWEKKTEDEEEVKRGEKSNGKRKSWRWGRYKKDRWWGRERKPVDILCGLLHILNNVSHIKPSQSWN